MYQIGIDNLPTVVERPMLRSIPQITLELLDNLSSELLMIREVSLSGIVPNRTMSSMWEKISLLLSEGLLISLADENGAKFHQTKNSAITTYKLQLRGSR